MQTLPYKVWAIACLLAIPNARGQDVFSSGGAQPGGQVVSSITDFHNGNCDVKIKNLRTGYIRSFTIPCGTAWNFKVGDPVIVTGDRGAPLKRLGQAAGNSSPLSAAFPKLVPSRDSSPQFKKSLKDCLDSIQRTAAADRASPVNRLLNGLANIPIAVHQRPATDTGNSTPYSPPGKAVDINWGLNGGSYPGDGASRIPCATLLHELTHAWENYNQYDNGEIVAVRAENWLIWKSGGRQRTQYSGTALPRNSVVWPQAGSASPK